MMARGATQLIVRQQPYRAQVVQENNPKNRKPIDPPPIIELKYDDRHDPHNTQWLVSPRTFMMVTLINDKDPEEPVPGKYLIGQTVSSLHRLKDINNKDGGFFVFGDISARRLGTYRLRFSLFDTSKDSDEVAFIDYVDSGSFPVVAQRDFGSMSESTHLTRTFSDQGVKLRVRKDNRAIAGVGNKRSFAASPPESSSPPVHSGIYGGAVQDHYSNSAHSPIVKRQRSSSDYDGTSMYSGVGGDTSLAQYSSAIPSATRSWTGNEQQRVPSSYGPQQSPLSMTMLNRLQQPMSVQTPSWQGMQQPSALPSPTPSVSTQQQPSYPAVTSQQQSSSLFGDPGSASSISRPYYGNGYSYPGQSQYPGQQPGDVQGGYSDLQIPSSAISDAAVLGSSHSQGYGQGYLQSNNLYSSDPGEESYLGDGQQKF